MSFSRADLQKYLLKVYTIKTFKTKIKIENLKTRMKTHDVVKLKLAVKRIEIFNKTILKPITKRDILRKLKALLLGVVAISKLFIDSK